VNQIPLDPTPASLRPIASTHSSQFDGDDPTWAIAAVRRRRVVPAPSPASPTAAASQRQGGFWPHAPSSLEDTGLRPTQVEALVLKFLLNMGCVSGREIARQIAIPFRIVQDLMVSMKEQQLVSLKSDAPLGDYGYELTDFGTDHARRYAEQCTYFGSAPVPLEQYATSVRAQSVSHQPLSPDAVKQAFHDLVMGDTALAYVGEALNLGRGMFLYGAPGNGKSSIAERIARVFAGHIWIPRALSVGGEILRLYDSIHHVAVEDAVDREINSYDQRWIPIKRPTIVMGGEMDLSSFDISSNPVTGISETPLQLKANCGTLVVDDFGRNRFRPAELLNRLVAPMERGIDSFNLKSGRTFQVPFDCMLVFASNAVPAEIVDEAFLRRIPFKIPAPDPDEQQFKQVYWRVAEDLGLQTTDGDVEYLLQRHYRETGRPMRFCHPRDLLRMIANACQFQGLPPVVTHDALDGAVERYVSFSSPK
jgi:hypothetical protein